ncbi:MAG: hypothetical protein GQ570_15390 [Helicobacteraceae bacterium]|nr:hypothetical protein [Helicobacteraceae bacterium]
MKNNWTCSEGSIVMVVLAVTLLQAYDRDAEARKQDMDRIFVQQCLVDKSAMACIMIAKNATTSETADMFYEYACKADDVDSCIRSAGLARGIRKKLEFYEKACELNSGKACNKIGLAYGNGDEIRADYNKAVTYYKKSCKNSYGYGCYNLVIAYQKGKMVKQNYSLAEKYAKQAKKLFAKDCDQRDSDACKRYKELLDAGF